MAKVALGKGLGALLNTKVISPIPNAEAGERVQMIPLTSIQPSPFQPRHEFRDEQLSELVESIRTKGIIQPLILRRTENHYELIAGERRWRAATRLGLASAPAIVREATDREVLELALIENLQRADLNPIEEAEAYSRLAREFSLTQEEIAERVGRSRAAVANAMRLLDLDGTVRSLVGQARLSVGHAKVLLGLKSTSEQRLLADMALRNGSTVRETERLVRDHLAKSQTHPSSGGSTKSGTTAKINSTAAADSTIHAIERQLTDHFGTRIVIHHGEKKGRIEIEYFGNDDLTRILEIVGLKPSDS
jgi:ParB family chromosome partitioning protein